MVNGHHINTSVWLSAIEQLYLEKEPSNPHDIIVVIMKAIMIQQYLF